MSASPSQNERAQVKRPAPPLSAEDEEKKKKAKKKKQRVTHQPDERHQSSTSDSLTWCYDKSHHISSVTERSQLQSYCTPLLQ